MAKRLTRTYEVNGDNYDYIAGNFGNSRHTVKRSFNPLDERNYREAGLDSTITLGRIDLDKLDSPKKIRVTVTALD